MGSSAGSRAAVATDAARAQLWPVPAAAIVVAIAAAVGLTRLDRAVDDGLPGALNDVLFTGSADAARSVLSAIAGSLVTVTALTFSLTVVTLQLASSQFSPRLLRTFSSDRFVHVTLGLFLATFTYALTVLRSVHSAGSGRTATVPQIAVTFAYLLTVASVIALVVFLAHLVREIRVETMLRRVHADAASTLQRGLGERSAAVPPLPPPDVRVPIVAGASGFITWIDEESLLDAAVAAAAVVWLDRATGDSVIEGTPIAFAWPVEHGSRLEGEVLSTLQEAACRAVHTGHERTAAQDLGLGLRQLTDVAVKALSPGINDPTTAVHALGHSAALLGWLAARRIYPDVLVDEARRQRVVVRRPGFADLLELAVGQPRRYGADEPAVLERLLALLREVAWLALPEHHDAIAHQLQRLRATVAAAAIDESERRRLNLLADQVEPALAGRWGLSD